ncbi:hypothetical protein AX15_000391 [Amanita polypyramis BW_CC]|nr:hypothetical protein AX15_000391 [Amanita polypyramis BW_CC]
MADNSEKAFAAAFLNTLASQPVVFKDDYQQPKEHLLKRVPVLHTPVPPPPAPKRLHAADASSSTGAINITFKSIKPSASYSLSVHPTDTISTIKSQLASTHPSAPPSDTQRLLLRGKALADNKLLKEYNIKDGDVVNLMIKPGIEWDPAHPKPPVSVLSSSLSVDGHVSSLGPAAGGTPKRGKHQRIPSVVLSPSPSMSTTDLTGSEGATGGSGQEKDILLTLDATDVPQPLHPETLSTYHDTVAKPEFWERLLKFLKSEFANESDAVHAFEDYLRATKGSLTPNEIAKIRDHTGIVGMAGT